MLKYLLILLVIFSFSSPVLAVKQVTGTVPEVKPLQPAPEGIYVNHSGNINYVDPSHKGQFDDEGNISKPTEQAIEQRPLITFEDEKINKTENIISNYKTVIVTIIIIIFVVAGYVFIKSKKVNE